MQHFDSDYMEGAHPAILEKLMETNEEKTPGYGTDAYCARARALIREACECPEAEVFFLVGGTQTNATIIDALLRSTQGALAADTGHIATHEAGAIEASGHKVITIPHTLGKIDAEAIDSLCTTFYADANYEHMVEPGLVYISHPTEYGTIYSLSELKAISDVARKFKLPLFMDGARLGYGLAAEGADLALADIARLCDVFYIGGTKVGALFGEAVVFTKPELAKGFFTLMKQHGALLAKGRLLGIQFETLFTENRYLDISRHAIDMAMKLKAALIDAGYALHIDSPTNQQFVVLDNARMDDLSKQVSFGFWEALDADRTVVRFATSWATREEDVDALIELL